MNIRKTKLFFGILFGLTLIFSTGCIGSESRAIRKAIETDFSQIKTADTSIIKTSINGRYSVPESENIQYLSEDIADIFNLFYKNFSYKIQKVTVEDQRATAHAKLKTIDAEVLAKDFSTASLKKRIEQDANPSEAEFSFTDSYQLLKDLMESKKYHTKSLTADIELQKKGDDWEVIHTPELDSLLTGNFLKYVTDSNLLSPADIVETHFHVIKNFDSEQLKIYLSLDDLLDTQNEYDNAVVHAIADQIGRSFNFKITGESREDITAVVQASITSVDFHSIMNSYKSRLSEWLKTSESLSAGSQGRREKERELLLSSITDNKSATEHSVDIPLIHDGVNWKIQMSPEIAQAVFGDVENAINSIIN